MHELALCESIASVVTRYAEGRPVASVQLRVGALRQVVPEALTFCWTMVGREPPLSGSVLEIDHVPGEVDCFECGIRSRLSAFVLRCPRCDNALVNVVAGEEFLVTSIELRSADPPPPSGAPTIVSPEGKE